MLPFEVSTVRRPLRSLAARVTTRDDLPTFAVTVWDPVSGWGSLRRRTVGHQIPNPPNGSSECGEQRFQHVPGLLGAHVRPFQLIPERVVMVMLTVGSAKGLVNRKDNPVSSMSTDIRSARGRHCSLEHCTRRPSAARRRPVAVAMLQGQNEAAAASACPTRTSPTLPPVTRGLALAALAALVRR
jgi:hypothetical protein